MHAKLATNGVETDNGQLDMDKQLLRAASKLGRRRPGVHQAAEGRWYIGIRGQAALHAS